MQYFDYIREYLDKRESISCVPVKGKAPIVSDWQSLEVTPEVIDSWEESIYHSTTGFGIRAGQHNIGWADIDTDDIELNYRFDEIMDLPPICSKKGKKGKTIFFRFNKTPKKSKYNVYLKSNRKKPVFEFNFTSGQSVLPPSIHPETGTPYVWIHQSLLDIDLEDLPIIDEEKIEHLEEVINASSLAEGLKNVPTSVTGDGSGKYNFMVSKATYMIHQGVPETEIAKTLVGLDRQNFPLNQFFFSSKIGKDFVSKTSDEQNAISWVTTYKGSLLIKDEDLRITLLNMPSSRPMRIESKDLSWGILEPLAPKNLVVEFPDELIPAAFKDYVDDLAELSTLPKDAFIAPLFTTMSAACQAKVTIRAKYDFHVHPSVSSLIIAPSGSRKDSIFYWAKRPLTKLMDEDRLNAGVASVEEEKEISIRLEDLHKKRKAAVSSNDKIATDELKAQILEEQKNLVDQKKKNPKFIFESGTQEALYKMMNENQDRGILISSSEYIQTMGILKKKGNEALRGFYLKLLNGATTETFNHETIGGLKVDIRKVVGCALIGVQTDVFAKDVREMESGSQADGLLQRFFLVNINPEIRRMTNKVKEIRSQRIDNLFALLYRHDKNVDVDWLDDDAYNCYADYDHEIRTKNQFHTSAIKSFKDKFPGQSIKIAWLYAQADSVGGQIVTKISKESYIKAVKFLNYQDRSISVVWSNMDYNSAYRSANVILAALKNNGGSIASNHLSATTRLNPNDMSIGLEMLVNHNYVRMDGSNIFLRPDL